MKFNRHAMHVILLTLLLALSVMLTPVSAQDEDTLTEQPILMTFIPNIQFAPMYVAIENGYFAEAGLDVSLEYLNEPDVIDLIAADQHEFGIVSGEQVILAASQGREIRYVYEWFQQYPIGIVYDASHEIDSIEDLAGLRVGIPGRFGASYSGLTTLLDAAGMQESDIQLEEIGFAAPEVFCIGAVDAAVVYANNEPLQIQNRADAGDCGAVESVEVLRVSDYVDLVSNGLITSPTLIDSNPDNVQAVVTAYDMGLRLTIDNPARAYLLSAPHIDNLPLSDDLTAALESLAAEQDEFLQGEYTTADLYASHQAMYDTLATEFDADTLIQFRVLVETIPLLNQARIGFTEETSWQNMQETLLSIGTLENPVDVEVLYTNAFVPADASAEATPEATAESD